MSGSKQETTEKMPEQNDDTIQPVGSNVVPKLSSGSEAQENASKRELNKLKKDQLVDFAYGLNKTVDDIRNTSVSVIAKTSKATPTDPLEFPQDGYGQYHSIPAYRRPQYKLDSGLPIFGEKGRYDNLDEWIFAIENSVKAVGVPRNFIPKVISPFLRGLPAQTLRQFTIDQGSSANCENFKELLLKFRSIICNLNILNLNDDEKVYCFAEGLNSKTKFEVKSKQCKTLEEAIRIASIFKLCCGKIMVEINSNKIYKGGKPYKKYPSNNFSLRKRINNRDEAITGIKCFKSNKMGHIAKNCRVKQENNVYKNETYENKRQKYKNKTVPVCKTSSDSILSIVGFVEESLVKLALDSGAVESIISNKIVERLGKKSYESNVQVKTATDDVKKVLGETEEVNVDIEGHTCRMSFLVLDMEDYEVLLGLNWFEQTGAGILRKKY
ncbi:unnamed protein product [Brachionus calyciflorus]|uniref:Uncharacterized protein n=1 Tax=Brachionus calyciflorus TaxID=104777 RepID=A0A814E4E8_9BILA|nr:unnamed protein product [Brachionus calyciflorus]